MSKLVVMDGVPVVEALERCGAEFAAAWWHWWFFAQSEKPAERVICAAPETWYDAWTTNSPSALGPDNHADFLTAIRDPATVHAMLDRIPGSVVVHKLGCGWLPNVSVDRRKVSTRSHEVRFERRGGTMTPWIASAKSWLPGSPNPEEPGMSLLDMTGSGAAEQFAQLSIDLHDSDGVDETVQAVVDFALQALDCSHAGVALIVAGQRLEIPAVTDPIVAEIYALQIDGGKGPLTVSMHEHLTVLVGDTAADDRWPEWAAKVRELGVRSVLDVPLTTAAGTVGVLGLYSIHPDAFGPDEEAIAHILARHASVAVASARHEHNLAQAVDARKLVGQAMGILMERYQLNGDQAFAVLRRYSQDTNTKLRDVALQLIDTRKLPGHRIMQ
ncbi:ANTAR domain-containing protein [Kribbella sp. CA-245084]|uniref:ANTAR domain-containing protein n=1 Tax=Kribbella sp. CA-245084 TaxID=3239940 RepID=UPI003D8B029A